MVTLVSYRSFLFFKDVRSTTIAVCGEEHSDTENEDCDSDSDMAPKVTTKRNESKVCRPIWKHRDMTLNDVAFEFRGNSYVPTSVLALETLTFSGIYSHQT